jgi:hypothetical protein
MAIVDRSSGGMTKRDTKLPRFRALVVRYNPYIRSWNGIDVSQHECSVYRVVA